MNDLISPFAPICADYAKKFDEAEIAHDIEMTKKLLERAKAVISVHDEPAYAHLFYSVGTSLTILRDSLSAEKQSAISEKEKTRIQTEITKVHGDAIWHYRHAEELINDIEATKETKPFIDGLLMTLFVNLGNAMDYCGRKCSAIDYYRKAMAIHPFGMALGNIGRCLEHYAGLEGDPGHRSVLIKTAYDYYVRAEAAVDSYTYQEAKMDFITRREQIEFHIGKEELQSPIRYKKSGIGRKCEKKYRDWCLYNHLFLNTLNDLPDVNSAFATDALHIASVTTAIDQNNPPFVFEMFNQAKEEYVYSRYLLFEVTQSDIKLHFADKETHLEDVLNYGAYSIRLEKLKTAFRTLYSLFDRIAFLLNGYLNLGIKERQVNFWSIWDKITSETEKNNIALRALHWIYKDFKEEFGDADSPHSLKLKTLRDALEHKFVSVHILPVDNEVKIGSDYIYRISEDHLIEYTMELLKISREALIELIIAIRIEEHHRCKDLNQGDRRVAHISLREYKDEYKM